MHRLEQLDADSWAVKGFVAFTPRLRQLENTQLSVVCSILHANLSAFLLIREHTKSNMILPLHLGIHT